MPHLGSSLDQVEPEPTPARDEDEASERGQRTGPFLIRIERKNVKAAGKENDADKPANDRSAPGRPALSDGEQGQRMDPLIKKGGMPETEMILVVKKVVDGAMGREGAQDDAEEAKQGSQAQSQTIRGGSHAGALLEGLKELEMRRKVTKLADKACHASFFLIKIKNDYGFPARPSDGGTPYWFARATP
jgi:hypothetical protein